MIALTKVLISCKVTIQFINAFVFSNAMQSSHDMAHLTYAVGTFLPDLAHKQFCS